MLLLALLRACPPAALDEFAHDTAPRLGRRPSSLNISSAPRKLISYEPATQLPIPALKDWSNRSALIGGLRFLTISAKSSSVHMERIGSNPSCEIGGSVSGDMQSRMRANLRGSVNASFGPSSSPPKGEKWKINWGKDMSLWVGSAVEARTYLHVLWGPFVGRRLTLSLVSEWWFPFELWHTDEII